LDSADIYDLHGGLLALVEIAKACESHFSASEQGDKEKDRVRGSLNLDSTPVKRIHRFSKAYRIFLMMYCSVTGMISLLQPHAA